MFFPMEEGSGFCHIFLISQFNETIKKYKANNAPTKKG